MSVCDDVRRDAAGLASLSDGDCAGDEARSHARACPECASLLSEARLVIDYLDAEPPPLPPSPQALARAAAPILADLDARSKRRSALAWLPSAAVMAAWGLSVVVARHRLSDGTAWFQSIAVAAAAALAARGVSRFGRWWREAVITASFALVLLSAWGPLDAKLGIKCVCFELISASLPLVATASLVLKRDFAASAASFASVAAAGALAGQAALHLTCEAQGSTPHLLAFHCGGVLLSAAIGWAVSRSAALREAAFA